MNFGFAEVEAAYRRTVLRYGPSPSSVPTQDERFLSPDHALAPGNRSADRTRSPLLAERRGRGGEALELGGEVLLRDHHFDQGRDARQVPDFAEDGGELFARLDPEAP